MPEDCVSRQNLAYTPKYGWNYGVSLRQAPAIENFIPNSLKFDKVFILKNEFYGND